MRLINADKLRFRHTVKFNSDTTRPYTLNCISFDVVQNAPTIKAVPIDVLDKIRAVIEQLTSRYSISRERGGMGQVEWSDRLIKESDVLQIIDKYRNEVSP